ncbi:transposase, IS605 OrfB family, central region [Candidatus Methanoperedens nitroreducens]|uniref:Transposase, IS605 OrfB family, central region n=1 Tax=Candidatus Methanoperedens nitratireducens TaxID=1392998 RepID=A0A062V559_9EURY|nr:zinc ribbon domain-containing protein [Candidatus Methanoperedens nitroreducens]KCZ71753.1 transposase, IS605 OrfB family, central region [Candidatus Methanoperedens nitroreducens]MDJ1422274.1 transposase [Candidatus Methanoperedens sp.]
MKLSIYAKNMKKRYKQNNHGSMRRTSRIYLNDLNKSKSDTMRVFLNLYQNIINYCICLFWSASDFTENLADKGITKSIEERFGVTARLSQCTSKQAKEIVRSQMKKSKRSQRMPRFKSHMANLDSRFVEIEKFNGHFEICIKTGSGVPKMVIPFNWTKHTNKFRDNGWTLSNSVRLGYDKKGIFIDLIFEKEKTPLRQEGNVMGVDRGFNCMIACSNGQMIGKGLKEIIKKGGKRRKSYHHFIETETNRCLKQLDTDNIKLIALEELKNVKANKRGKFSRKVNRLLSFWHYARVGKRLEQLCEEKGICIAHKSPWKTSQRCSVCGNIDRRNRKGERFLCLKCESEMNADYNASKNLELLGLAGVYSLRSLTNNFVGNKSL